MTQRLHWVFVRIQVSNLQHFASDIEAGRWDNVIREVSTLSLPDRKAMVRGIQYVNSEVQGLWHVVSDVVHRPCSCDVVKCAACYFFFVNLIQQDLYEHICHEMIEYRDFDATRSILKFAGPMVTMKTEHPDRYLQLATLLRNASGGRIGGIV